MSAARDDDVGVALARLDELEVHRLHRGEILVEDFLERPAALDDIASQAANQADIGVGVDEHLHRKQLANARVGEQQDAVDHDDVDGRHVRAHGFSHVRDKIVLGLLDRCTRRERRKMSEEQLPVEGIGMIPVDPASLLERQMRVVVVVRVHVDERDGLGMKRAREIPRDRRLAGPRSAGDPDHHGVHVRGPGS